MPKRFLVVVAVSAAILLTPALAANASPATAGGVSGTIYTDLPPQGACATLTTTAASIPVGTFSVSPAPGGVLVSVQLSVPTEPGAGYTMYQNCVGQVAAGSADSGGRVSTSFFVPASSDVFADAWEFDGNFADGTYFRSDAVTVVPGAVLLLPTTKDQCKNGGWQSYSRFKNQGDCVSFVATGGANAPSL